MAELTGDDDDDDDDDHYDDDDDHYDDGNNASVVLYVTRSLARTQSFPMAPTLHRAPWKYKVL